MPRNDGQFRHNYEIAIPIKSRDRLAQWSFSFNLCFFNVPRNDVQNDDSSHRKIFGVRLAMTWGMMMLALMSVIARSLVNLFVIYNLMATWQSAQYVRNHNHGILQKKIRARHNYEIAAVQWSLSFNLCFFEWPRNDVQNDDSSHLKILGVCLAMTWGIALPPSPSGEGTGVRRNYEIAVPIKKSG